MLSKEIQLEVNKGAMLPLMEEFYTIQGEGSHTGTAAYFIRIGGCDVGCHWCDVKESWNAELHPPTNVDLIVANATKYAVFRLKNTNYLLRRSMTMPMS
jgi:organic radical activating enzyme